MTSNQKQAIKVLMNLYNEKHINEEQFFLLLNFIISDTRNEIKISEYPWDAPKSSDFMPITVMYGCNPEIISYDVNKTDK
jgi:hypothetical protein